MENKILEILNLYIFLFSKGEKGDEMIVLPAILGHIPLMSLGGGPSYLFIHLQLFFFPFFFTLNESREMMGGTYLNQFFPSFSDYQQLRQN